MVKRSLFLKRRMRRAGSGQLALPTRRTVLRGLLGGAAITVGLPPLEAFFNASGTAYADGAILPRRFGLFYWGNGNLPEFWTPTGEGSGDDWQLSEQLAPLAPVKRWLSVVSGMEVKVENLVPHGSGRGGFLAGGQLIDQGGGNYTYPGATIDQLIAREIGNDTRFRSLEFGVAHNHGGESYNGPNNLNPAENDPYLFFERVFGEGFRAPGEEVILDPRIGLRRSVLDAVLEDANRLSGRVSADDRARLDQHLTGIRELELRLARLEEDPPDLAACERPEAPEVEYPDIDGRPQLGVKNRIMCDLAAMAMACDQTRVVSNFFSGPVSNVLFPEASDGHHNLTHDEPGDQPEVNRIVVQVMEEFSYMLQAMANIEEGDATLLDNSCVLATSDVSLGRTHSLQEWPILLAGGACGRLKTDFHYRSVGLENTSRVMLSLMRAYDIVVSEFGIDDTTRTGEGLAAIEA